MANPIASALSYFVFDTITVPAVGTCAISTSRPPLDVTPIGSWNSYFIEGVLAAAGTLDVYYNKTDHEALVNAGCVVTNAPIEFSFVLKTNESIDGFCIITGWDIVSATTDVLRGQISFQIVGQVDYHGIQTSLGTVEQLEAPAP